MTILTFSALNLHAEILESKRQATEMTTAKVCDKKNVNAVVDIYGNTALHLAVWGNVSIKRHEITSPEPGDLLKVRELINCGADVNARNNYETTPLLMAAEGDFMLDKLNNIEIIKLLLDKGADVNMSDKAGYVALNHYTRINGSKEIIEILLDRGSDTKYAVFYLGLDGGHSYNLCMLTNDDYIVDNMPLIVSRGSDINYQSSSGRTALHVAAECGYKESVQTFISLGADANKVDEKGRTALHLASNVDAANILLKGGADVNKKDTYGNTPLVYAFEMRRKEVIKLLIANGAKE